MAGIWYILIYLGREPGSCGAAPADLAPDIPGSHQRGREVLDGRPGAGAQVRLWIYIWGGG